MKRSLPILLAVTTVVFAACSQSTAPATDNSGVWKSNNGRAILVFDETSWDSSAYLYDSTQGRVVPTATVGTLNFEIGDTGLTWGGKQHVGMFYGQNGSQYAAYESNGDFSFGDSSYDGITWKTFPTGSHRTIADPIVDSTDAYGYHTFASDFRSFVGTESLTLATGETYSSEHVREISVNSYSSPNSYADSSRDVVDYWYVPTIGFFAKMTDDHTSSSISSNDTSFDHSTGTLILTMYGPK